MTLIHRKILSFLENEKLEQGLVDKLIVSAFLIINDINVKHNLFIKNLIITDSEELKTLDKFITLFKRNNQEISFEVLIKIFEFVVSPTDKEVNGAIYTPKYIREYIVKETSNKLKKSNLIGDIACGCGGFLYDYAILIHHKFKKTFSRIFKDNIYGIDITEYSITRTKILLSLLAISHGEDKKEFKFNLYIGNSLSFDWSINNNIKKNNGFDIIVGNPPYVGATRIDEKSKKLLKNWSVTSVGKADLYIPFFEIGIHWLTKEGVLGYITVNTFYKSVNGRAVRSFFAKNEFKFKLIDFGGEQVFNSRNTYTCICIISNSKGNISFVKTKSEQLKELKEKDFATISYNSFTPTKAWMLNKKSVEQNIKKIEQAGQSLGSLFDIKNGFATLRNKIFLFKPTSRENGHYILKEEGKTYKIETAICRDAIKPNILKHEDELNILKEKLIFPYESSQNLFGEDSKEISLIKKEKFKNQFIHTYNYLSEHKEILAKRDKGKRKYEEWYAYGRTQALNLKGKKLLFPYLSNKPYFVYTDDEDLMFYNGYAIISNDEQELKVLQKLLHSDIFWYYIKHTSKPYSSDYFALAKNYIKNFGICELSKDEKEIVLSLNGLEEINKFFFEKYQIEL